MTMRRPALVALVFGVLCAAPVLAVEEIVWTDRLDLCVNTDVTITDREASVICTTIIDDPAAPAQERTIAFLARGDFSLALMRYDQALADYGAAIRAAPTDYWRARSHAARARVYLARGEEDCARAEAAVADRIDPEGNMYELR